MLAIWSYDETDDNRPMTWRCGQRHDERGPFVTAGPCANGHPDFNRDSIPDLSDPATLGCLLALVRAKHGQHAQIRHDLLGWYLWLPFNLGPQSAYPTEAEALVAALEARRG